MSALYSVREFSIPQLTEDDYSRVWPKGTLQITKELKGFRANGKNGYRSRFHHALNLIRLLWPDDVELFKIASDGKIIWNHFLLDGLEALCSGRKYIAFTGCSSSGKTFCTAIYALLMFMSNPSNTTVMVSTTAGSDAERRVWGEIKDLHNKAKFKVGTLIDYIKVITFDPTFETLGQKDIANRDLRNGIALIPIPDGNEGQKAIGKIIGTKQKDGNVIWIVDEMPNMMAAIMAPCANLNSNKFFQFVGIGNAALKTDAHGMLCEPRDGWNSITAETEQWISRKGALVINFNGMKSPNYHPSVVLDLDAIRSDPMDGAADEMKSLLPFPYLWNQIAAMQTAYSEGAGHIELGERTIGYARFAVGFWHGDDVSLSLITEELVKASNADKPMGTRSATDRRCVAGLDPAWSSGGDSNDIMFAWITNDSEEEQYLVLEKETVSVNPDAISRDDFRKAVARKVVAECRKRNVKPSDFGMDINGDGGLMFKAICEEWGSTDPVGLSSLESIEDPTPDQSKYSNIVTMYWFQAMKAIASGNVREFNLVSGYAKDLMVRQYASIAKGKVAIEQKKDLKKRIRRSPDKGDAFCYMIEMARRAGFSIEVKSHDSDSVYIPDELQAYSSQSTEEEESDEDGFSMVSHGLNVGYSDW